MAGMQWTREDDKRFETALLIFPENLPHRFEQMAISLQKPVKELLYYHNALVHDLNLIESGHMKIPNYVDDLSHKEPCEISNERKRGVSWSAKEHGLFLEGLKKCGKGDWKNISRQFVKTRTPTQVASHAQKYFERQKLEINERKRSSIHDITISGYDLDTTGKPNNNDQDQRNN